MEFQKHLEICRDVFHGFEQLVKITRELTEALRKNRTIDWQKKESARAGMRKIVKRLLKKGIKKKLAVIYDKTSIADFVD